MRLPVKRLAETGKESVCDPPQPLLPWFCRAMLVFVESGGVGWRVDPPVCQRLKLAHVFCSHSNSGSGHPLYRVVGSPRSAGLCAVLLINKLIAVLAEDSHALPRESDIQPVGKQCRFGSPRGRSPRYLHSFIPASVTRINSHAACFILYSGFISR